MSERVNRERWLDRAVGGISVTLARLLRPGTQVLIVTQSPCQPRPWQAGRVYWSLTHSHSNFAPKCMQADPHTLWEDGVDRGVMPPPGTLEWGPLMTGFAWSRNHTV